VNIATAAAAMILCRQVFRSDPRSSGALVRVAGDVVFVREEELTAEGAQSRVQARRTQRLANVNRRSLEPLHVRVALGERQVVAVPAQEPLARVFDDRHRRALIGLHISPPSTHRGPCCELLQIESVPY
jgi:hypothetical protein